MWAFQHFYSGQIPPPWLEHPLRLLSGENGVLVPAPVQAGVPKTQARRGQLSPSALNPGQGSCRLPQAPRRHPLQGVLPGQGAGGARMREGEWHGPGIHFNSITYMERHTLHSALRRHYSDKATERCTFSPSPSPHNISPSETPQPPKGWTWSDAASPGSSHL